MQVKIENIGKVHKADIQLDGLTVLTGLNGVGKSAIGKAIYCAFESKAFLDIKKDRTNYGAMLHIKNLLDESFHHIPLNQLYRDESCPDFAIQTINDLDEELRSKSIKEFMDQTMKGLSDARIERHNELIQSSFQKKYNSSYHNQPASINIESKDINIHIQVVDNKTIFHHNKGGSLEATMIETPTILGLYSYIKENLAFSGNQKRNNLLLPDYVKKLIRYISESGDYYYPDYNQHIAQKIESIIQGQVVVVNDAVYFKDNEGHSHPILNVASGIKSFGLLQLLAAGKNLDHNSILIIDEPEVHLHPAWQIKYVQVLMALVKQGIRLLVTSHSPYFIEALKVYSDNEGLQDQTHFYWGETTDQGSVFEEETGDLEKIFASFSYPMVQLEKDRQ